MSSSDIYANIVRQQYQDWYDRFYPKQKELMDLAINGQLLQDQLGRVETNNANALRSAQQETANRNARMGVATQQNSQDNSQDLRMSLMTAGTENGLREQEQARQMNILTGADGGIKNSIKTGGGMM
ncbi:hypothetical protein [Aeromonas enteropelogenes]|uniref:hypothetical protein n=1 Tax=Aeromonas enteropelogenes TaxID=29489 RepID=UPI003BA08B6F